MSREQNDAVQRQWLVLGLASAANFVTILDLWAVGVAYPVFQRAFAPAALADISWILNAYAIVLASLLVPAGRIADKVGRKRAFLTGLLLFGVASLGCGLAPSLPALVAFRALQGAASALLMPTSLGFALSAFPAPERATALGIWVAVGALAASAGPPLGGLLMALDWRWLFFINVPLVAAALVVAHLRLPAPVARGQRPVDWLGAALIFGATACACTALVEADRWTATRTWSVVAAAVVLATATVLHASRHPDPIVAPRLLAVRRFRLGATAIFSYFVGSAILMVGSTLLLMDCWNFSILRAALAIAPGPLMSGLVAPFAGRLTARFGYRFMIIAGAALFAAAGLWQLLAIQATPSYAAYFPVLVFWALSNALVQPTLFASADAAPAAELSSASAVLAMARQLGSAFGVALLVAALAHHQGLALSGLRRGWAVVVVMAALTAAAGLRARAVPSPALPAPTPLRRSAAVRSTVV